MEDKQTNVCTMENNQGEHGCNGRYEMMETLLRNSYCPKKMKTKNNIFLKIKSCHPFFERDKHPLYIVIPVLSGHKIPSYILMQTPTEIIFVIQ